MERTPLIRFRFFVLRYQDPVLWAWLEIFVTPNGIRLLASDTTRLDNTIRGCDLTGGSGPGFESRSGHHLDLFLGSPGFNSSATLVNCCQLLKMYILGG